MEERVPVSLGPNLVGRFVKEVRNNRSPGI